MVQNEFTNLVKEEKEMMKVLEEAGECAEVKELVTQLAYKPVEKLSLRYQCVKWSREEGNFEFFKKIANLLAEKFKYSVQDGNDEYECCIYYGNNAYSFLLILSLARFYKKNQVLFDGHFDIIQRMCGTQEYNRPRWEDVKNFWLKHTLDL